MGVESLKKFMHTHKFVYNILKCLVELVFLFVSFFLAFPDDISTMSRFLRILVGIWGAAFLVKIFLFISEISTMKEFRRVRASEALSASTLLAQQRANEAKARAVQQVTYGHVPEWHPLNFQENVLPYDVHEQLRVILIEIRNAVLSYANQMDTDMLTVDLAYCYPSESYDGRLPADEKNREEWRIITSGNSSCMNYDLHDFLCSSESFYFCLEHNNYEFFNDKHAAGRYYIPTGKDHEYGNVGSIVGMTVSLKNDAPESVLVKAILTITTYGWKLCDNSGVSEEIFRNIFKQNVLNGYKSLLRSELSQMFIRHMIRNKKMCPFTGVKLKDYYKATSSTTCPFSHCPLNITNEKACYSRDAGKCKCDKHKRKACGRGGKRE